MQRLVEKNIATTLAFRRNATARGNEVAFLRNAKIVVAPYFYRAIHPYGMKTGNWAVYFWRKPNVTTSGKLLFPAFRLLCFFQPAQSVPAFPKMVQFPLFPPFSGFSMPKLTGRAGLGFPWRDSMRRTVSIIVCVLFSGFCAGLDAQIPEGAQFQPGSYGVPYRSVQSPATAKPAAVNTATMEEALDALDNEGEEADDSTTAWEKKFSPQTTVALPVPQQPQCYEVPHLTFVYNHWTGRFNIAPYEPGYAANPAAFPKQTSPLHIWVSSKSSAAQPSPQVPYMSYYDPDPVILPAEIRLYGTKIAADLAMQPQIQPMPLPVPRPANAQPIPRQRPIERLRQNLTPFVLPR